MEGSVHRILAAATIISLLAAAAGASIQLSSLGPESMVFLGNASFDRAGQIELNMATVAAGSIDATTPTMSSGRALYNLPFQMLNPSSSFESSFTFSTIHGSSLFFVVVPNNQELFTLHGLSLRFATADNAVTVWSAATRLATTFADFDLGRESRRTFASVSYDAAVRRLQIRISNVSVDPLPMPAIVLKLDLAATRVINQFMYVGFSASSTLLAAKTTIYAWNFTSWIPGHPDPAALDSKSSSPSPSMKKRLAGAGIAVTVLVIAVVAALIVVKIIRSNGGSIRHPMMMKSKFSRSKDRKLDIDVDHSAMMLRKFTYKELVSATAGFDLGHKLGPAAYSQCYRGVLSDCMVAIKVVDDASALVVEELLKLVVELGSLRHRNLVNLIGWCNNKSSSSSSSSSSSDLQPGSTFLVYEFIPNGSLDEHLFASSNKNNPLPWSHRHKIACGLAQAVEHLHSRGLVHGNIKSSNVLLDANFTARLGDYSLKNRSGRDGGGKKTLAGSMIVAGTFGYVAPEAVQTGKPSSRADVFAFGAVVLELVSGRRALEMQDAAADSRQDGGGEYSSSGVTVLVDRIRELVTGISQIRQGDSNANANAAAKGVGVELEKVADVKLGGLYDVSEMEVLVTVGLACSDLDPGRRPGMEAVVKMLAGEVPLPRLLCNSSSSSSSSSSSPPGKDRGGDRDLKMKAAAASSSDQRNRRIEELLDMKDFGSLFV